MKLEEPGGIVDAINATEGATTALPPRASPPYDADSHFHEDSESGGSPQPASGDGSNPPSPRGLKRTAEEDIAAADPEHIAAHQDALAKKKRLCRYPGCTKVIKSQGHCQRHGARAKRCKVEGCDKQAQGTHDGMCKRHWKATNFPEEASKKGSAPPEPEGESVYDSILPMSIAYRPVSLKPLGVEDQTLAGSKHDLLDPPAAPEGFQVMPLVAHLKEGALSGKPAGWHRNQERRARGLFPVKGLSIQLEPWERQLALIEIMLLSGGTPYANFKDLAFAWGREKGFHHVLANSVCERRGEVERKKRSDAGKSMTDDEKLVFRSKLQKARDKNGTSKRARKLDPGEEAGEENEDEDDEDEADSLSPEQNAEPGLEQCTEKHSHHYLLRPPAGDGEDVLSVPLGTNEAGPTATELTLAEKVEQVRVTAESSLDGRVSLTAEAAECPLNMNGVEPASHTTLNMIPVECVAHAVHVAPEALPQTNATPNVLEI